MKKLIACLALILLVATSVFAQSVPASVEQKIRQIYAEKYSDNSSMQKTLINDQLESYRFIQRWTSEPGVPQDVFNKVKTICAQKFPDNYSMQKTLIKDQCESYRFIQSYTSETGVPNSVIANLKQEIRSKISVHFAVLWSTLISLIETDKACGLEPHRYLRFLFERLPYAGSDADYQALLPQAIDPPQPAYFFYPL